MKVIGIIKVDENKTKTKQGGKVMNEVSKMKLYTFLDDEEDIIEEVRAETHAIAYKIACDKVDLCTEFFSETIGNKEGNENKTRETKMIKIHRKLTKEQIKQDVIFTSCLSETKTEGKNDFIHKVLKDADDIPETIRRLKDDKFFNNSQWSYNIIRD